MPKRNHTQWVIVLNLPNRVTDAPYENQEVIGPFKSKTKAQEWVDNQYTFFVRQTDAKEVVRIVQLTPPEAY